MKRICHIVLMSCYQDGLGYQENILAKKHVQLGYEVSLISISKDGEAKSQYVNSDGVIIHILPKRKSIYRKIPYFRGMVPIAEGLYGKLVEISPDILFVHGINFPDAMTIFNYKKHNPQIQIFADNHQDYYNSAISSFSDRIIYGTYMSFYSKTLAKLCKTVWGVTPWRVDYMIDVLKVPQHKTGLLVMGGDEDFIDWNHRKEIRSKIRTQYHIPEDATLLISGGHIDLSKNVHLLAEAVSDMSSNYYLIIFGSMSDEIKSVIDTMISNRIITIGWLNSNDVYQYFLASDLAVFPGTHSVLWEQACASGIPAIFRDWGGGFDHVDVGGNCIFVSNPTVQSLRSSIESVCEDDSKYEQMLDVASRVARQTFSYIQIAKQSIGVQ